MAEFFAVKDDLGAEDALNITSILISQSGAFALKIDDPYKAFSFYQDLKFGTTKDNNGKIISIKSVFIESYNVDVIKKSQNQCNNNCSDTEYNEFF